MSYIPNQLENTGLYWATTENLDPSLIYSLEPGSPEFKEFISKLVIAFNNIQQTLNLKTTGTYDIPQFQTGQLLFPLTRDMDSILKQRPIFRKVIDFGVMPDATSISIPHGITITSEFNLIKFFGGSFDPVAIQGVALPNEGIYLTMDSTYITVTVTANYSAFTNTKIILEYTLN